MGNVTLKVDNEYKLSMYQEDAEGLGNRKECVPIDSNGIMVGEPVTLLDMDDLMELVQAVRDREFSIWQNQYVFEFEEYINDNEDG